MKKGFTLTELLCVIIIIGILVILAIPSINNIINSEKQNISDAMKNIIIQAGELYVQDNSGIYPNINGKVYCVTIQQLIDNERLQAPLKDPVTNNEINTNYFIKVNVENNTYNYELSDTCTIK